MRTEMVFKTFVYLACNYLMQLLAQEGLAEFKSQ